MNATVWKRTSFDAAHFLPKYKGLCSHMHGHTYTVELGLLGKINPNGMVVDLVELSKFLKTAVEDRWDHSLLNDSIENPTAENIAMNILVMARKWFDCGAVQRVCVRVYETPTSWVEVAGLVKE